MASTFSRRLTGSHLTQTLSQKVQNIYRYPLIVHRDTRRINHGDEAQARLTSAIPVVTNSPGLKVSIPSPQALTLSGGGPEQNLFRKVDSPMPRNHALQGCVAPGHGGHSQQASSPLRARNLGLLESCS